MNIYLDNAATTKVDEQVLKEMLPYFSSEYGNASSVHDFGQDAKNALEKAREIIAKALGARPKEVYFTSGGTESNNLALEGLFYSHPRKNHIITTKVDHDCVLNTCKWLEEKGVSVTYLKVNKEGFIDLEELKNAITDKTLVVSIIHGNNEIGTIQDLEAIGEICKEKGVLFHTDACQSFTKVFLNTKKQNLSLVTLNSHKIHGPKGVGALYVKEGIKITPLLHGGGHEKGLRSGTENVSGIIGFAKAVDIASSKNVKKMEEIRDYLTSKLLEIPNVNLNGPKDKRLCNNVHVSFNDVDGEALGGYLENDGIYTSTGSACSSHSQESSHVLKAIGLKEKQVNSSLRISISKYTTKEEIDYVIERIKNIVERLRRINI